MDKSKNGKSPEVSTYAIHSQEGTHYEFKGCDGIFVSYHFYQSEVGKSLLKKVRNHFQLNINGEKLLHTKLMNINQTEPIPISYGDEVHYSEKNEFYLLPDRGHLTYTLKKGSPDGVCLCTIIFTSQNEIKRLNVTLHKSYGSISANLNSVIPVKDSNNLWTLDFAGKHAEPNPHNFVLKCNASKRIVLMMRQDYNCFLIDSAPELPPEIIFSIALAMRISPTSTSGTN